MNLDEVPIFAELFEIVNRMTQSVCPDGSCPHCRYVGKHADNCPTLQYEEWKTKMIGGKK